MSQYQLLTAPTVQQLNDAVNNALMGGWVLYGPPAATVYYMAEEGESVYRFMQTVVMPDAPVRNND